MKQKGKIWRDHTGKEIPTYAINPVLRVEETHTHRIAEAALKVEKYLREVVELTAKAHKEVFAAKMLDAKIKGNSEPTDGMTISSFDNSVSVKITRPDNLIFDNTYTKLVREKFDEYFASFGQDSEEIAFMRDLINDLMYTSGGNIDQSKVLKLRKYRERMQASKKLSRKAELFIEAVDIFDKAIRSKPGGMGIYVDILDESGRKRRVPLKYTDI